MANPGFLTRRVSNRLDIQKVEWMLLVHLIN